MKFVAQAATILLVITAPALSAQLQVPQDHASIQGAIDAASAGDVILVNGGDHGPFVIDKPLTLIGSASDRPVLRTYSVMEFQSLPAPSFDPPVTLAGPGFGVVTLAGFEIGGDELFWEYQDSAPAIGGGGFDGLRVLHCEVAAPEWSNLGNPFFSPGIDVDVAHLLVRDSSVVGGKAGFNGGYWMPTLPSGGAGILSTGDVDLFDSHVRGGEGFDNVYDHAVLSGPGVCEDISDGEGGPGVSTPGVLRVSGSTIEGGPGADVYVDKDDVTTFLCQRPDGAPLDVGQMLALDESLSGDGPLVPLTHWTLSSISASSTEAFLVLSLAPSAPVATSVGPLYMPIDALFLLPVATGETSLSFPVRDDPALLGATVVIQRYDLSDAALSRPVHATFLGE